MTGLAQRALNYHSARKNSSEAREFVSVRVIRVDQSSRGVDLHVHVWTCTIHCQS